MAGSAAALRILAGRVPVPAMRPPALQPREAEAPGRSAAEGPGSPARVVELLSDTEETRVPTWKEAKAAHPRQNDESRLEWRSRVGLSRLANRAGRGRGAGAARGRGNGRGKAPARRPWTPAAGR